MSDSPTTPGDRLNMSDLKAFDALVTSRMSSIPDGDPQLLKWGGCLARVRGEVAARPPSLANLVTRTILDCVTQSPTVAEKAVGTLSEAFYKAGDVEGSVLIKRAATTVRSSRAAPIDASNPGAGRGRGGSSKDDAPDDRIVDWYEAEAFNTPVILDERMRPRLERLVEELRSVQTFLDLGIEAPSRMIFHGPPGVGKTLVAKWIGAQLGTPLALVRIDGIVSKWVGDSGKNLRAAFDQVRQRPGAIVFLDEVDGLLMRRDTEATGGGQHDQKLTSTALQQLDALPADQIVIASTNIMAKLDPSFSRRLPTKVEFFYPDAKARRAMIEAWWKKVDHDSPAIGHLVGETEKRSADDLRALSQCAARLAIMDKRVPGPIRIRHEHVVQALSESVDPGTLGEFGAPGKTGTSLFTFADTSTVAPPDDGAPPAN